VVGVYTGRVNGGRSIVPFTLYLGRAESSGAFQATTVALRAQLAQYCSLAKEFPDGMTARNIELLSSRSTKSCASLKRWVTRSISNNSVGDT
jgi:hypothetical protein